MSRLTDWIGLAVGLALFFGLQAAYWLRRRRHLRRELRLKQQLQGQQGLDDEDGIRIRARQGAGADTYLWDSPFIGRLRAALIQGGVQMSLGRFIWITVCGGVGVLAMVALAADSLASGIVAGGIVLLISYVYVIRKRDRRIQLLEDQLPRALETMVFSLRAGHGLEEAIRSAAEEVDDPLSRELNRCYEEYELGRPIEGALEQLRARWPSVPPIYSLVEAVVVLKRTGGNIVAVLGALIDGLRSRVAFESRHRSLTAEGRLSARILMALPLIALFAQAVLSPQQIVSMVRDGTGRMALLAGAGLWVAGSLWVAKLVRPTRGRS